MDKHWTDNVSVTHKFLSQMALHAFESEEWTIKQAYHQRWIVFPLIATKNRFKKYALYLRKKEEGKLPEVIERMYELESFEAFVTNEYWFKANTRCIVLKWLHMGLVERVARGRYKFTEEAFMFVIGMKRVFDITDRGYRIRAYWGKPSDAEVTIHKGKELYKKFVYPAYKVFNLAAHFADIVDSIIEDEPERGFAIAGSDGLGGSVMPREPKTN